MKPDRTDVISPPRPSAAVLALLLAVTMFMAGTLHAAVPQNLSDQTVSDAVGNQIASDLLTSLNDVDVTTTNGVVTLTGIVGTLVAKERAARIAESVKGVRSVVNQIAVSPYSVRTPLQVESAVKNALLSNPATESYEVGISVRNGGLVTLSGTVQSYAEKQLTETVTKSVVGVTDVHNDIRINYALERPDSEIRKEVQERLRWNVLVDDGLIEVAVDDGRVALSGTVGSAAEQREALLAAWVGGVTSVDTSKLTVERWARDDMMRNPANTTDVSDAQIEQAIRDALMYDPRVIATDLRIESTTGAVTLRGNVGSLQAKRAAEMDAIHTFGVKTVDNRLKVRPVSAPGDQVIVDNVREALARDSVTESWEFEVSARGGVVTLEGEVDNYYEKARADQVASGVRGVEQVRNYVTVADRTRPYAYDPYYDAWPPYSYDWYDYERRYSMMTDSEIKEEINSEMWWSPFVDANQVDVMVDNGVATLSGTVDSWGERSAAQENAFEGGATWVVNRLEVE